MSALVHPSLCLCVLSVPLHTCAHLCSCACFFVLVHASGGLVASASLCTLVHAWPRVSVRLHACAKLSMLVQSRARWRVFGDAHPGLCKPLRAQAHLCVSLSARLGTACTWWAQAPRVPSSLHLPLLVLCTSPCPLHVPVPLLFTLCPPRDHIYAFDLGQDKRVLYPERVRGTGAPFLGSPGSRWGSPLPSPISPAASHLGDAGQGELRHAGQAAGTGHGIWGMGHMSTGYRGTGYRGMGALRTGIWGHRGRWYRGVGVWECRGRGSWSVRGWGYKAWGREGTRYRGVG